MMPGKAALVAEIVSTSHLDDAEEAVRWAASQSPFLLRTNYAQLLEQVCRISSRPESANAERIRRAALACGAKPVWWPCLSRLLLMDEPELAEAIGTPHYQRDLDSPLRRRPRPDLVPSHNRPNPRCTDLATCAQGVGHMTRGGRHRAWTTREVAFLIDAAGRLPLRTICKRLGRSESAVESMASKLNRSGEHLTLKCWSSRLVWCNECATWRTGIDDKTGRCRVCTMREQLRGREDACSRELAIMTPEQRLVYERTEAQRRTRKALERPQKREAVL